MAVKHTYILPDRAKRQKEARPPSRDHTKSSNHLAFRSALSDPRSALAGRVVTLRRRQGVGCIGGKRGTYLPTYLPTPSMIQHDRTGREEQGDRSTSPPPLTQRRVKPAAVRLSPSSPRCRTSWWCLGSPLFCSVAYLRRSKGGGGLTVLYPTLTAVVRGDPVGMSWVVVPACQSGCQCRIYFRFVVVVASVVLCMYVGMLILG